MKTQWKTPSYEDNRFGFEVTMYIYNTPHKLRADNNLINTSNKRPLRTIQHFGAVLLFVLASLNLEAASKVDIENTRSFTGPINASNVGTLLPVLEYLTAPDTGTRQAGFGSVSSTPAVKGRFIYFNDMAGNITKLNRFTFEVVWKKSYARDLSIPGMEVIESRVTPYISHGLVIVGSNFGIIDPLCAFVNQVPAANVCTPGSGAIVLALNKNDGSVVWRKRIEDHPAAKVTGSISGQGSSIFVPVGSWEEDWARAYPKIYAPGQEGTQNFAQPIVAGTKYPCCTFRGSLVALNVKTGAPIWKTHTVMGTDANNELEPALHNLLVDKYGAPKGFTGTSTYGHNPTVDTARKQVYISTAQNQTAPRVAELCELARRSSGNPNANIAGLPAGVTCDNLNQKLRNYANAIMALDMNTGVLKWAYWARKYDAWNHACGAPDFYGWGAILPLVFPVGIVNNQNCDQDPIGPDVGFGNQPMLVKNVTLPNGTTKDLVVAGNKDGRLFALDPATGAKIWETNVDPGGIYGGLQFGRASDGQRIYFGTTNTRNAGRKPQTPFVPAQRDPNFVPAPGDPIAFLDWNGFTAVGVRTGPFVKSDAATPDWHPAPADAGLPFPGPNLIYGISGYPFDFPLWGSSTCPPGFTNPSTGGCLAMTGPASGPAEYWRLVNPPSDVKTDCVNVFDRPVNRADPGNDVTNCEVGKSATSTAPLYTTAGMVQAVRPSDGAILWQRPAIDAIAGNVAAASAFGTLSVGNGVVFIGYQDNQGTMMGLDSATGKKLFRFNNKVRLSNGTYENTGGIESGPAVAGRWLYWGAGLETGSFFPNANLQYLSRGNRVYGFKLPVGTESADLTEADADEAINNDENGAPSNAE